MSDSDHPALDICGVLLLLSALGCLLLITYGIGAASGTLDARAEAAKSGAGEYVVDPTTGKTDWKWKPAK